MRIAGKYCGILQHHKPAQNCSHVILTLNHLGIKIPRCNYHNYQLVSTLVVLIVAFGQKAFEKWVHKNATVWIPYGGILTGLTWGLVHILTKGNLSTGVSLSLISIGYGITYLLVNRDIKKAYIWILLMFIL